MQDPRSFCMWASSTGVAMAAQNESQVWIAEIAAGPLAPNNQTTPVKADDAASEREVRPVGNDSLLERFLNNLRLALSVPHA